MQLLGFQSFLIIPQTRAFIMCFYVRKFIPGFKIDVNPPTDEKYINFPVGVPIRTYPDKSSYKDSIRVFMVHRFVPISDSIAGELSWKVARKFFKTLDRCFASYISGKF